MAKRKIVYIDSKDADLIRRILDTAFQYEFEIEEGALLPGESVLEPDPVSDPLAFRFSEHSLAELEGVDSKLIHICHSALNLTKQDFMVFDGIRTEAEQRKLVAKGASQTMDSKHLTGKAVDLVPWINGKATWDFEACCRIAWAVYQAASAADILSAIRWGACWDQTMFHMRPYPNSWEDMKRIAEAYTARRKSAGKSAFIDAVHFELVA